MKSTGDGRLRKAQVRIIKESTHKDTVRRAQVRTF